MELSWVLRLVLFGVAHWVMAGLILPDIAARQHVLGGRKWVWVVVVVFVSCFGSIAYLLAHPQMLMGYSVDGAYREEKEDYSCR